MLEQNKITKSRAEKTTKPRTIEERIRIRRYIGHVLREGNGEERTVALTWTDQKANKGDDKQGKH